MSATAIGTRPPTPFKELDFFVEADALLFAGREREARQLVARIINSRAIVVHARSGLGKTSLLRAGVIPLLRQQDFRPVYVRTLDSLLGDLAEAVVQECQLPPSPSDGDQETRTRHVIEAAAAGGPLVLVLDQFEEFFTRFERQPRDRQAFVQFITDIVRDERRDVRVVFSLREDYLYALDEFQRKLPDLFAQAFRLLPLTPLGAREAIIRPLVNEKVLYDEALITQLVDELTGFDFDSARLQVTCSEVYRHALASASGGVELRAGDLNSLKESTGTGLPGIYKRYLREAVARIDPALHLEARLLLDKLISAKRTKFAIGRDALHAEFTAAPWVDLVLTSLIELKLVRSESRGGKKWFELRHECLIEEILEWFKEDATFDSFRFVRGLIEEHSPGGLFRTRPERLLTADQLTALLPLHERLRLAPEQFEYVFHSALYLQSPELRTWARADLETAARLLRTLSTSSSIHMRIGALLGIGQLGIQDPDLRASCLALAFDDSVSEGVRAAARKSAAIIATNEDLAELRARAMPEAAKPHLREFLVEVYVGGRMGKPFSAWQRWWTRQDVIRESVRRFSDQKANFVSRGIMGGLAGSGVFVGPAVVAMLTIANLALTKTEDFYTLFMIVGCLGSAGAVIGWRNGAVALKTYAIGETRWWKASLPSVFGPTRVMFVVTAVLLIVCFGGFAVSWLLLRYLIAVLVAVVEPMVRRWSTPRKRIIVASFICLPPAFLLGSCSHLVVSSSTVQLVLWVIACLFFLLNIELCSFILAIPEKCIERITPEVRPSGGTFLKG
jgi:hypothetical protein